LEVSKRRGAVLAHAVSEDSCLYTTIESDDKKWLALIQQECTLRGIATHKPTYVQVPKYSRVMKVAVEMTDWDTYFSGVSEVPTNKTSIRGRYRERGVWEKIHGNIPPNADKRRAGILQAL